MDDLAGGLKPIALLERVAAMEHPVTLAELAVGSDVPRPTLHRWLNALTAAGLLQRAPDGRRFELAPRASQLAFSILSNQPGAALRHGLLEKVVRTVGESCNLTVLHGTEVTYIDRVEAMWPLRITFQRGSRVPAHCSASGKLFLALMPPAKRDRMLRDLSYEGFTENTITDRDALLAELAAVRKQRYALDREEYLSGLVCLAVPVIQRIGRSPACIAALAMQAPVSRLSCDAMIEKLPALQDAAQAMSGTLE
ncbi:IclR family transcriptional regulator [Hansschlegelia zhihuaiae]|uniref:IclR family transcriptional regulator n=2 Tax=Hansschlegelia zhihuaiae TaxID=405005 RepID=A0A4Q0ML13_9HYPH|nr:IclR family transcriptional regulator [Hansschlegelia zhihuaiae]RXF74477.1 IclR family transcriptional regulator [Hansschlegelia zhihuaiae]